MRRAPFAVLAVLALVAFVRFHGALLRSAPATDERVYLRAFHEVATGSSPYGVHEDQLDYYYPPPFARLGAAALARVGERPLLALFRLANLAGLVATLWIAGRWGSRSPRTILLVAAAYLLLAPPALRHGIGSGNLSLFVVGATWIALALVARHPFGAGALLASTALVKPIAPIGLVALVARREGSAAAGRSWLAAAFALALAAAPLLLSSDLDDYLNVPIAIDEWPRRRSVSLYRWLHLTGLPVSPLAPLGLVALLTAWCVRRAPLDPRRLFVVAIVAMTLATPALWGHTMLLVLPLQAMACGRWWTRRRRRIDGGVRSVSPLARYELPFVVLAAAALQFVDGIGGGIETAPRALQLVVLAVPLAAPLALAAYVWSNEPTSKPPGNLCAA